MDVTTISAPVDEAKAKLAEYRAALKKQWNKTDQILAHTYRQLAKGRLLIDVRTAILSAGCDENHRPKLAIARADQSFVWWVPSFWQRGGRHTRSLNSCPTRPRSSATEFHFAVSETEIWPTCSTPCPRSHYNEAKAMLPLIPPRFRPVDKDLDKYHVLWDAQGAWEAEPPTDPFLLKRVHGDLFAVLAVWDLSDLERAVLKGIRAGTN